MTRQPQAEPLHGPGPGDLLRVDGLCFSHPHAVLFDRWSGRFPAGVSLVRGGDGSGKTTLLRLLAGDLAAQDGRLQLGDADLHEQGDRYRQQVFRTDPQSAAPDPLTPLQWLDGVRARRRGFDAQRAGALLDLLALREHQNKPMYMLSTGSRRKVWLVAAFASNAMLTLLDQPFAALDRASIARVTTLLQDAAGRPDRVWVLADFDAPDGLALVQTIALPERP